jgi:hypothetical protein
MLIQLVASIRQAKDHLDWIATAAAFLAFLERFPLLLEPPDASPHGPN